MATGAPRFERLNYFFGQELGVAEFRTEQAYFRDKLRLHNRCLHGHGVVHGLLVTPDAACLTIDPGLALDPLGNDLYVPEKVTVEVGPHLRKKWVEAIDPKDGADAYVVLAYHEQPLGVRRWVGGGPCRGLPADEHGRSRDWYCVRVYPHDPTCPLGGGPEPCGPCDPGEPGKYVLLAKIHLEKRGTGVVVTVADNAVRRPVSKYPFNVVTGINWTHAGAYQADKADAFLKKFGLNIWFRRPVRPEPLYRPKGVRYAEGAVEVLQDLPGGHCPGNVQHIPFHVVPPAAGDMLHGLHLRMDKNASLRLDPETRVQVVVRGAALLDACCTPLDAVHVGGWVPFVDVPGWPGLEGSPPEYPGGKPGDSPVPPPACAERFAGAVPWTSGAGAPGGNFESWFFIT